MVKLILFLMILSDLSAVYTIDCINYVLMNSDDFIIEGIVITWNYHKSTAKPLHSII